MQTRVDDFPEPLSTILTAKPFKDRVLSVSLDTTPAQIDGTAYLLTFRELAKSPPNKLPVSENSAFEAAVVEIIDGETTERNPTWKVLKRSWNMIRYAMR